jgi:hypothetical protein
VLASCTPSALILAQTLPAVSELRITGIEGTPLCKAEHVATRLAQLFEAISDGHTGITEEYFGPNRFGPFVAFGAPYIGYGGGPFRWFSFTELGVLPPNHYVAYSRDDLKDHVRARHAAGQRMMLRGVRFNRHTGDLLHFGPVEFDFLTRDASDAQWVVYAGGGKGAYHCPTGTFAVLSLTAGRS